MSDRRRAVVRAGYDDVAERYLAERPLDGADVARLDQLTERLAPGAPVLDAGCGAGIPVVRHLLAARLATTGLDVSRRQLELARELVPDCRLVLGDLAARRGHEPHAPRRRGPGRRRARGDPRPDGPPGPPVRAGPPAGRLNAATGQA